jgi:hypothetical protein
MIARQPCKVCLVYDSLHPSASYHSSPFGATIVDGGVNSMYLDSNSRMVFPGSAGVAPAQKAASMVALPGYNLQEHNGVQMMSGYLAYLLHKLPHRVIPLACF